MLILSDEIMPHAVAALCRAEPRFENVVARHGLPSLRAMTPGFESLLHIVTEQFLSLKAAHAIWLRLAERLRPFTAETVLAISHAELRALGLSGAKAKSFHGIAREYLTSPDLFEAISAASDEEARKHLISLPGVGPWTADIYLLAALQRADIWPWGDLALRHAAGDLLARGQTPDHTAMRKLGEDFAPWRAVAARLLWSHYRGLRGLEQAS
ncbi:DNA-3-methyladenine glycosylase family protein [Aestuariivirga sp.]|uniref:DNA-3-methyladenine glycosylase family protein n=1 Tax=Aestuariivirga sp. TaxID=2650926 RepID=UPI0039E3026D